VLYEGSPDARAIFPAISPDGRAVAFALGHAQSWDGVWVTDVATGAARQLLAQPTSIPSVALRSEPSRVTSRPTGASHAAAAPF
jgi:hypothetical protein